MVAPEVGAAVRRLRLARAAADHTQAQCADELNRLGADRASQSAVSLWERHLATPKGATTAAIRAYIEHHLGRSPLSGSVEGTPGNVESQDFDKLARDVTGEPLLTPRQAALVDALTNRLRTGSTTLSHDEVRVTEMLWTVLRLPRESSSRDP